MQLLINATNVKIVIFIELNDKDAYCAYENARNVENIENIDAFMNMSQLKVTQIWNMRLNEYSRYWSLKALKALKSVTVTLYKLQMCYEMLTSWTIKSSSQSRRVLRQQQEWWWKWSCWSSLEWQEHSFFNMQSSWTNLIHSLSFIVLTACSSCINSERFSISESFVHSTYIA